MSQSVRQIISSIEPDRILRDLNYLSADPLPCRTLNYTRRGTEKCTLYEADEYITDILSGGRFAISADSVPVQAFVPDRTASWGFRKPLAEERWYEAFNIFAVKHGHSRGRELVVVLAHKDSQSWLDCGPGANDNAVGVAALLEISRILSFYELDRTVMLLFCNEEHWPWTSVHAAEKISRSSYETIAVLNLDSIGGKSYQDSDAGRLTNVTRFTTPEGASLARLIAGLNEEYGIGLEQTSVRADRPNDDDGSFVNAGILPAVLFIGSYPYADPNYHTVFDTPDKVDIENVCCATQLALATILTLCGIWIPVRSRDPTGL